MNWRIWTAIILIIGLFTFIWQLDKRSRYNPTKPLATMPIELGEFRLISPQLEIPSICAMQYKPEYNMFVLIIISIADEGDENSKLDLVKIKLKSGHIIHTMISVHKDDTPNVKDPLYRAYRDMIAIYPDDMKEIVKSEVDTILVGTRHTYILSQEEKQIVGAYAKKLLTYHKPNKQ